MQIKLFVIPIFNGESEEQELNKFLRSHKVLHTDRNLINTEQGVFWCFCVSYLEGSKVKGNEKTYSKKEKVDFKEVLGQATFERFSRFREIRKQIAQDEGIPAYAVFTNNELAEIAKLKTNATLADLRKIDGIGAKKVSKYGVPFLGYRLFPNHVRLAKRSSKRYIRKFKEIEQKLSDGVWDEAACQNHFLPLLAFSIIFIYLIIFLQPLTLHTHAG